MIDISVVVPTFNRSFFIAETLESILAQKAAAKEIIVVDDGSTDGTAAIVERFGDRVRYHRVPQGGVQAARNAGIAMTSSPWIALCDDDDLWRPDYLSSAQDLIAAQPGLNFLFSNSTKLVDGEIAARTKFEHAPPGYWENIGKRALPQGIVFEESIAPHVMLQFQPMFPSSMLFTRLLVQEVGPFDTRMRGIKGEDAEFIRRCLYRAKAGALTAPLVLMRRHTSNASGDNALNAWGEARGIKFVLDHHDDARIYEPQLRRELMLRNIKAFDAAFADRKFWLAKQIWTDMPQHARTASRRSKYALACLSTGLSGVAAGLGETFWKTTK